MVAWIQPPADHELFKEIMVPVGTLNGTPKWTGKINNVGWSSASEYSHTTRNLGTGGLHQRWLKSTDASVVMAITDAGLALVNLTVSGNLIVQGNTTLGDAPGDTVVTSGPVTVGTTLLVTTDLTVNGEGNIKGNVTLGDAITDTVLATGPVTMNATLNVKGNVTLGDAVGDTVVASGNVTVQQGLTVNQSADIDGNLNVDGSAVVDQDFSASRGVFGGTTWSGSEELRVIGQSLLGGDVTMSSGTLLLSSGNIDVQGGTAGQIRAGVVIVGATSLSGGEELRVVGQSRMEGNLTITTGGANIEGSVAVTHTGNTILDIRAAGIGFNGAAGAAPPNWTVVNYSTVDRSTDQTGDTLAQLRDAFGQLIIDLIAYGLLS
jgi:hypothetical protein